MKKIQLTKGKFAIVDDSDFEYLNQWKWNLRNGYPSRTSSIKNGKKRIAIYMHKLINNTADGFHTDHINRNKLDNRRCNLRSVTRHENSCNRGLPSDNTSGFRGVTWHKYLNKWMAQIGVNRKTYYLGLFVSKEDAAKAYDDAAIKFFGKFSNQNLCRK